MSRFQLRYVYCLGLSRCVDIFLQNRGRSKNETNKLAAFQIRYEEISVQVCPCFPSRYVKISVQVCLGLSRYVNISVQVCLGLSRYVKISVQVCLGCPGMSTLSSRLEEGQKLKLKLNTALFFAKRLTNKIQIKIKLNFFSLFYGGGALLGHVKISVQVCFRVDQVCKDFRPGMFRVVQVCFGLSRYVSGCPGMSRFPSRYV